MAENKPEQQNNKKSSGFIGFVMNILDKSQAVMRNRLWISGMIVFQGVMLLFFPNFNGVAIAVASSTLFTAGGILLGYITSKSFNKTNARSITIAIIFLVASAVTLIFPQYPGTFLQIVVGLSVIVKAIFNLVNTYRFKRKMKTREELEKKLEQRRKVQRRDSDGVLNNIAGNIGTELKTQAERVLSPATMLMGKTERMPYGQISMNIFLLILGFIMIFFSELTNALFLRISGLVLIVTGIIEIVLIIKSFTKSVKKYKEFVKKEQEKQKYIAQQSKLSAEANAYARDDSYVGRK